MSLCPAHQGPPGPHCAPPTSLPTGVPRPVLCSPHILTHRCLPFCKVTRVRLLRPRGPWLPVGCRSAGVCPDPVVATGASCDLAVLEHFLMLSCQSSLLFPFLKMPHFVCGGAGDQSEGGKSQLSYLELWPNLDRALNHLWPECWTCLKVSGWWYDRKRLAKRVDGAEGQGCHPICCILPLAAGRWKRTPAYSLWPCWLCGPEGHPER